MAFYTKSDSAEGDLKTLPCFRTERDIFEKRYSLEHRFEGQRFPFLTNKSRAWPVNHL